MKTNIRKNIEALSNKTKFKDVRGLRSFRKSKRVLQFATRVTPEFDEEIRELAYEEELFLAELLEKCLKAYLYLKKTDQLNMIDGERERERERERASSKKKTKN